jgi:ribosomal protein L24
METLRRICDRLPLQCNATFLPLEERGFLSDAWLAFDRFTVGTWVRVKDTRKRSARYFNDLGIIQSKHPDDAHVSVLLVPRLPFTAADYPTSYHGLGKRRQRLFKFPARLFDHSMTPSKSCSKGVTTSIVNSDTFHNGLFVLHVLKTRITVETDPSHREMMPFVEAAYPHLQQDVVLGIKRAAVKHVWSPGDKVRVVCGTLKGMFGELMSMDLSQWTAEIELVVSAQEGLETILPQRSRQVVSIAELSRYFQPGDNVKCVEGIHEGRVGIVLLDGEDGVVFVENGTTNEVTVSFSTAG